MSIQISVMKRGHRQVAPDVVFFRAALDTQGITQARSRGDYDESFHRVLYVWDFGDPGAASSKVVNLPEAHNDLNRAHGKEVAHVFRRPGRHSIRCTAFDLEGRQLGSDSIDIAVDDPARLFAGPATIFLDPDGAGDPQRYPDAWVVQEWASAWAVFNTRTTPSRIVLRDGITIDPSGPVAFRDTGPGNLYIQRSGTGPEPPVIQATRDSLFWAQGQFADDLVLSGLDFRGTWDSTTETGTQFYAFRTDQQRGRVVLMDDCTFDGFGLCIWGTDEGAPNDTLVAMHDCEITNWGDLGFYLGVNVDQYVALLGTAIHQHPRAMMGGGNAKDGQRNQHGPVRLNSGGHCHISVCDLFSRNGWSDAAGVAADQPCLRWSTKPDVHATTRSACNVERCAMEGGFTIVSVTDENNNGPYYGTNFVMDKCLLVGTARTIVGVMLQYTGVTIRNCLMVRPGTGPLTNEWLGWTVRLRDNPAGQNDPFDPVEIYSNTMVNLMPDSTRDGGPLPIERGVDEFEVFSFENNLVFAPYQPGGAPAGLRLSTAPLATAAGLWSPRYAGPRYHNLSGNGAQVTLDTRFATPEGSVADYTPLPGATPINSAVGTTAADDFFGRLRSDRPDRGAIEA